MSTTAADSIAGVVIPDTELVREITAFIRDAEDDLLFDRGVDEADARKVWLSIALHTTPSVPEFLDPEIALVTAGVETDVLGIERGDLPDDLRNAVTAAHPR